MSDTPSSPLAEPGSGATAKPMPPSASVQAAAAVSNGASPALDRRAGLDQGSQASTAQAPSAEPTARGASVPMPMTRPKGPGSSKPAAILASTPADAPSGEPTGPSPKSPLSYLVGSLTSALIAWLCLLFSQRVVLYFTLHPPHYSARFAQSIATAIKTLIVGMGFLSTFSSAFVALGLFLVFIRSLSRAEAPGAS